MKKLEWEDTKAIREALFHSRLDHEMQQPGRDSALQRVREAEEELGRLLGMPPPFTYAPNDPETGAPAAPLVHEQDPG